MSKILVFLSLKQSCKVILLVVYMSFNFLSTLKGEWVVDLRSLM